MKFYFLAMLNNLVKGLDTGFFYWGGGVICHKKKGRVYVNFHWNDQFNDGG